MITAEDVRTTKTQATFMDFQGFYRREFRSVEYPALVRVEMGPRGAGRCDHTVKFYVGDVEVPKDAQAIADALNEYELGRADEPLEETPACSSPVTASAQSRARPTSSTA